MPLISLAPRYIIIKAEPFPSFSTASHPADGSLHARTYHEAYREFWGLGIANCWKQHIDGRDHQHGVLVYDKGLHNGNAEEGYWASSYAALKLVSCIDYLMKDPSVEMYKAIQKEACRHFNVNAVFQAGKEAIGEFFADRTPRSGKGKSCKCSKAQLFCESAEENSKLLRYFNSVHLYDDLLQPSFDCPNPRLKDRSEFEKYFLVFKEKQPQVYPVNATLDQFMGDYNKALNWLSELRKEANTKMYVLNEYIQKKSSDLGLSHPLVIIDDRNVDSIIPNKSPRVVVQYLCKQEELEPLVNRIFDNYNENIRNAKSSDEKLRLIADLFQTLEWVHPFADGQGRTDLILLNKELCRHGFTPAILDDPYVSTSCTLEEWVNYLKEGMQKWQKERDVIRAKELKSVSLFILDPACHKLV